MPPAPNAIELLSVPVSVSVLLAVNVLPFAIVSVALVAGAVIATLLTLVADATPRVGVTRVGDVARTTPPVPVTVFSPNTPELSYKMRPLVPPLTVVVPTVMSVATLPTAVTTPLVQVVVVPSHFIIPAVVDGEPLASETTGRPL